MTSNYEDLYSRFLSKINDYKYLDLDTDLIYEEFNDYLHSVCNQPFFRKEFQEFSFDDEEKLLSYSLKKSIQGFEKDYVEEVIIYGMLVAWLEPTVNRKSLINQMVSGSKEKFYSQQAHLKEVKDLLQTSRDYFRKLIRDNGYAVFVNGHD